MAAPTSCGLPGMADCSPISAPPYNSFNPTPSTYVVNSKIMVVAVAVLFAVVVFILCLHVYAKWFWRNQGALGATDGTLRTVSWRRRRRAANPNLSDTNPSINNGNSTPGSVGLEKSVIAALPIFEFEAKAGALECAVCLEEFEDREKGRTLPKCGHHFHLDCVDMWLHSHSTCPLCRASVRPDEEKGATTDSAGDPDAPVIGAVHAPFMAAMRASRRRQRSRNAASQVPNPGVPSILNLPTVNSPIESAASEPGDANHETTTSSPSMVPIVDPKALALQYETPTTGIPSNGLLSGSQAPPGAQPSASQQAPFQVTIDIPGGPSQSATGVVLSPMARASAGFRRLISRGKSVVSPQEDGADEGGPSTSPPHHCHPHHQMPPPSPPPPNQTP